MTMACHLSIITKSCPLDLILENVQNYKFRLISRVYAGMIIPVMANPLERFVDV